MNVHEEVEFLREKVRQLEALKIGETKLLPEEWNLTALESRIVWMLLENDALSKREIFDHLYHGRFDDAPDLKVLDAHNTHIRRKLNRYGIEIRTRRAVGHYIPNRKEVLKRWNLQ